MKEFMVKHKSADIYVGRPNYLTVTGSSA